MTAYSILSSTSHALTGTAYTFQPGAGVDDPNPLNDPKSRLVRVWGDVNFHVATHGDATVDDMPISAGLSGILLNVPPGGSISVVKMAGEDDGEIWFSIIKRT